MPAQHTHVLARLDEQRREFRDAWAEQRRECTPMVEKLGQKIAEQQREFTALPEKLDQKIDGLRHWIVMPLSTAVLLAVLMGLLAKVLIPGA